jgi:TolB protein
MALLALGCGGPEAESTSAELAFVTSRDGDYAVYTVRADGVREQRLSAEMGEGGSPQGVFFQLEPAWSPDGRLIAFSSLRDGTSHLFVMEADGSGTRNLTSTAGEDDHPTWAPDGRRIAFARGGVGDIYVMDEDGTHLRRLGNDLADERQPAWSPDGRWIAYIRRRSAAFNWELWLVRPDGTGRHQLTHLGAESYSPAWSPNSRRLVFSSNAGGTRWGIYTIGLNGRNLRRVTRSSLAAASDEFEPAWSPDGKLIAFVRDGRVHAVDGTGQERDLTTGQNDGSPTWRPAPPR